MGYRQHSMSSRGVNGCERRGDLSHSPCATCISCSKLVAEIASSDYLMAPCQPDRLLMTSSGFAGNPLCHREQRSLRTDAAISAIALVLPTTVFQGLWLKLLRWLIGLPTDDRFTSVTYEFMCPALGRIKGY